jgi:hypothetical protein
MPQNKFVFERYGDSYQLRIESADDLRALDELDEPFWMATSAPTHHFRCDPLVIDVLDPDGNGRVLSNNLRKSCAWMFEQLKDTSGVTAQCDVLKLAAINTGCESGERLDISARRILENIDEHSADSISLDQVRDRQKYFADGDENGDGIIPPESVKEDDLRDFIVDIMSTMGSVSDLSDREGVNREQLETFLECAQALVDWLATTEIGHESGSSVFILGEETGPAFAVLDEIRQHIDGYFELCDVVTFSSSLGRKINEQVCPDDIFTCPAERHDYLLASPLAIPTDEGFLRVDSDVNPAYAAQVSVLSDKVLRPLLGEGFDGSRLMREDWQRVKADFESFETWINAKTGGEVEMLGPAKLQMYLDSDLPERLSDRIDRDMAIGAELDAIGDLETLIVLQRWMIPICNNFVSFPNLYDPNKRAMLELGRLVIDGRIFNFNIRVKDVKKHAAAAERSGIYLLYSEVTGGADDESFFMVTPITSSSIGNLGLNKQGVLFDLTNKEWDVRVIKVVENPVSLRVAVLAPFKRLGKVIASTADKVTTSAEKQLETGITKTATTIEKDVKAGITKPAVAPAPAASSGGAREMVFSGGMAVAALGSSFAFVTKTVKDLEWAYFGPAVLLVLAIVIIPTVLVADYKLRRRNLSDILEASGWAVNAPMRLTRNLAALLAVKPVHPESFTHMRHDVTNKLVKSLKNPLRQKAGES